MEDEDEVDILGDFNLENLLTRSESRMSCYDGEGLDSDYRDVPSQWVLDGDARSAWYDREEKTDSLLLDTDTWTDKEKQLLEKGLELFGESWSRLSQYIGSKTWQEVKSYVRSGAADDPRIPASVEEVITVVSTAQPTVQTLAPKRKNSLPVKQSKKVHENKPTVKVSKVRGRPKNECKFNLIKPRATSPVVIKNASSEQAGEVVKMSRYECLSEDSEVDVEEEYAVMPETGTRLLPRPPRPQQPLLPRILDYRSGPSRYSALNTERLAAVRRLPPPQREVVLQEDVVTDLERTLHPEFFSHPKRANRLHQRYLKIRSHIVSCWEESRPNYVTKTSVRVGLKNCGDVNLISRVHAFLEQAGAINFGCDQCRYASRGNSSSDEGKWRKQERPEPSHLDNSLVLNGTRTRKKRIWSPEVYSASEERKGEGGYTMEHDESGVVTVTHRSEAAEEESVKRSRKRREVVELIACRRFTAERPAGYSVEVGVGPLVAALVHAYLSPTREVMGLLGGGAYREGRLDVRAVVPCAASSSDVHCDMCPVSQCEGAKALEREGLGVVGWYHSHPGGAGSDPSAQDVATQASLQSYFGSRAAPFTALVLSPAAPAHNYKFFTLEDVEGSPTPFELDCRITSEAFEGERTTTTVADLLDGAEGVPYGAVARCLEDVAALLSRAEPSLDATRTAVFLSRLESLLTGERNHSDSSASPSERLFF